MAESQSEEVPPEEAGTTAAEEDVVHALACASCRGRKYVLCLAQDLMQDDINNNPGVPPRARMHVRDHCDTPTRISRMRPWPASQSSYFINPRQYARIFLKFSMNSMWFLLSRKHNGLDGRHRTRRGRKTELPQMQVKCEHASMHARHAYEHGMHTSAYENSAARVKVCTCA